MKTNTWKMISAKHFDGAAPWQVLLVGVIMVAPFLVLVASL